MAALCRHSSAILELGANVGYFTVQGAKAGPNARYIAVEPYPASARVCRANLELNQVESVELVTAAAVAHTELSAVELHVPWDQLATPIVAFIGADTELPERMGRRITQYQPAGAGQPRDRPPFRRGRDLPNDAALLRLAGMLLLEQNDESLVGRRYLS